MQCLASRINRLALRHHATNSCNRRNGTARVERALAKRGDYTHRKIQLVCLPVSDDFVVGFGEWTRSTPPSRSSLLTATRTLSASARAVA
jgi:hypothetical protein